MYVCSVCRRNTASVCYHSFTAFISSNLIFLNKLSSVFPFVIWESNLCHTYACNSKGYICRNIIKHNHLLQINSNTGQSGKRCQFYDFLQTTRSIDSYILCLRAENWSRAGTYWNECLWWNFLVKILLLVMCNWSSSQLRYIEC